MYSSGYSQVHKYSQQAQKKMQHRSKGKSCGYYMRIIFFFSSLIQSLIIVSLVLFLVYGKTQDSASETRVQDLEQSFSRLSIENVALRLQRKNLTNLLNATLTDKARNDFDLADLRRVCNISFHIISNMETRMKQCNMEIISLKARCGTRITGPPIIPVGTNCGPLMGELKARYDLLESNFTQTKQRMKMEKEQIIRERDNLNLEAIRLRRDKSTQRKEIEEYQKNAKTDMFISFSHVTNLSRVFREKIETVFPRYHGFQLSCPKQQDYLEQIQTNCTNLSREVEDKLQSYLDTVGRQLREISFENNYLKAENWRLTDDYRWCSHNRTAMAVQHQTSTKKLKDGFDEEKEKLLMDKLTLIGEKIVLEKDIKYRTTQVDLLTEKNKQLNASCSSKSGGLGFQPNTNPGWNLPGGGSSSLPSSSNSFGQFGRTASTGTGSLGSLFPSSGSSSSLSNTGYGMNKPASTGTGSLGSLFPSSGSSSSLSNTGYGMNKPASTGTGSLGSLFPSSGSSSSLSNTGYGMNKPASTGGLSSSLGSTGSGSSLGSIGTGSSKPVVNVKGSTGTGSSSSSSGSSSSQSTSGIGSNKPTSNVKTSSWFGSAGSSSSSGSSSKSGSTSTGLSWLGTGSSNSGQSKTGSTPGKTSSGTGYGGTGSSYGGGRTSGISGEIGISQHLMHLHRLINPSGPQEKQDLSRILG